MGHLTWPLNPPQNKQKTKKETKKGKQKENKNQHQKQSNNKTKTKQLKQKQNQDKKRKTNTRTPKHLNLPNPNKQESPTPQKPPKLGKTSILNTFATMADTPKRNYNNIKTSKQKPPKYHFAMFKNNPLFFINFLFCSTCRLCFWKAVFCWKHYKNSVYSKTQLFKNTVSKTHFFTHVKKHLFQEKCVIFGFGQFPLKPLFL